VRNHLIFGIILSSLFNSVCVASECNLIRESLNKKQDDCQKSISSSDLKLECKDEIELLKEKLIICKQAEYKKKRIDASNHEGN